FTVNPQRRVCDKWAPQNDPAPTTTPHNFSSFSNIPQFGDHSQTNGQGQTSGATITQIVTFTNSAGGVSPAPTPTTHQPVMNDASTASSSKFVVTVVAATGGPLLFLCGLVWIIGRRQRPVNEKEKKGYFHI
ncbi:hypothetical protein HDU76_007951, partial [Blyttiomyces sp. JEL0837]